MHGREWIQAQSVALLPHVLVFVVGMRPLRIDLFMIPRGIVCVAAPSILAWFLMNQRA